MKLSLSILWSWLWTYGVVSANLASKLSRELQPLVSQASSKYGTAYALGLVSKDVSLALVAGSIDSLDAKGGSPGIVSDTFAWGSVTKTFTGAGIMQLIAAGKLKLDDRAERFVDPMLKRAQAPYETMQELFQADRWGIVPPVVFNASEVTVRHLLSMVSGISDYDTDAFRHFQYTTPELDMSPLKILDWVHGPLLFRPGGPVPSAAMGSMPMNYCSVNFILLGYILAYFSGAESWLEYDQASVVPPALHKRMANVSFSTSGSCGKATRVHGFDAASRYAPYDVTNTSCLGGWTAGNIVMPAQAAAEWARALWGPTYEVVPEEEAKKMVDFPNESFYGLATMNMTWMTGLSFLGEYGQAVGHLGDTYGFTSMITYFPKLDVAFAIGTNHEDASQAGPRALLCTTYNRALDIILERKYRNCTYVSGSYYKSGCKCDEELLIDGDSDEIVV